MTTPIKFLFETKEELQKVVWPGKNEITRLTIVVIVFSVLVGIYIGGIDFLFTKILEVVLK